MDIGTLLLYIVVVVGILDILLMLIGPRIRGYETGSFALSFIGCFAAVGTLLWLGFNIFTNNFQYEYIYQTSSINSDWLLKLSALWAGQPGSLVFWTALSFLLYFGFRIATRGYDDDVVVYRAYIIMAFESILIAVNAIVSDPFKIFEGAPPLDGLGLNPLLRTIWNVVHPPLIFIAYALALVPFAVRLAGFTIRTEERNSEKVPIVESMVRLTTLMSWIMLSVGIALGGYWAYIVLGWGGYWAWDPVETSSLIPWLLLTCYYHASAVWKKNDVLRDSLLVFAYLSVLFATWVTRSGVLTSVHGFNLSIVSWTMLATVLVNFIIAALITMISGFIDLEDDEEDVEGTDEAVDDGELEDNTERSDITDDSDEVWDKKVSRFDFEIMKKVVLPSILALAAGIVAYFLPFFTPISIALADGIVLFIALLYLGGMSLFLSMGSVRKDPIRIGLLGLLIIAMVSTAGIVVPAARNLYLTIFEPASDLIAIDIIWFRLGFYAGSILLLVSSFFCMKTTMFDDKVKRNLVAFLLIIGGITGALSLVNEYILPTNFWIANMIIPLGVGAVVYLVITFVRYLAGREPGTFTMKKMGRYMLHLGMVILLLGVFMSENVVYDDTSVYLEDQIHDIGPVGIRITEVSVERWVDQNDFYVYVTVEVIEGGYVVGYGRTSIRAYPEWGMASHSVYVHSTALRDVFVALTGLQQVGVDSSGLPVYEARLTVKVLPLISFVWLGTFLMVAAILPNAIFEGSRLLRSIRDKQYHLYGEDEAEKDASESIVSQDSDTEME